MKNYDAIWGSGDVQENGIWTADWKHQVLGVYELHQLNVDLLRVIGNDWSDEAIEGLIVKNEVLMAIEEAG